jgi:hypothetical protein
VEPLRASKERKQDEQARRVRKEAGRECNETGSIKRAGKVDSEGGSKGCMHAREAGREAQANFKAAKAGGVTSVTRFETPEQLSELAKGY